MGFVISKFRKEPPTLEQQLETLEKQIFQIHEFNEATEHAMKKIIGAMLFYGTVLIIIGGVVAYFVFDHSSVASSLICFAPVLLAPIVLFGSKRLLQYHYTSRIERKKEELNKLIKKRKSLINRVKETETYKKAQEILEKYDPDTRMRKAQAEQQRAMAAVLQQTGEPSSSTSASAAIADEADTKQQSSSKQLKQLQPERPFVELSNKSNNISSSSSSSSNNNNITTHHPLIVLPPTNESSRSSSNNNNSNNNGGAGMDIRRRMVGTPMGNSMSLRSGSIPQPNQSAQQQQFQSQQMSFTPLRHGQLRKPSPAIQQQIAGTLTPSRSPYVPRTARPILPQERGTVEKVIDYIVGEGPNNRFALICKKCCCHNGMALREEFEYLAFQCCYCLHFNPARKQRPLVPPPLNISAANSTTSLNDISRSGSPVPAGPSTKDSDQENEVGQAVSDCTEQIPSEEEPNLASGDAPKGARPAPEGNENDPELRDDQQCELLTQQELQLMTDETVEEACEVVR